MKFLCDRCKTRYSIGDDRVRGKILKIRCKNCANVITVREGMTVDDIGEPNRARSTTNAPMSTAPAPPPSALASAFANQVAKPPPALEEEWYVSIDGNQFGPFSLADAQRWISTKPFDADLHCWSEGFDDWLPVDKVSHFRGLRKKPRAPTAPPPLPRMNRSPGSTAALQAREEEPKPLFAATMASLEKAAGIPPSPATPPNGILMKANGTGSTSPVIAPVNKNGTGPNRNQVQGSQQTAGAKALAAAFDSSESRAAEAPKPLGPTFVPKKTPAPVAAVIAPPPEPEPEPESNGAPDEDDSLDIGEVSRVVKLADLAKMGNSRPKISRAPASVGRASGSAASIRNATGSSPKLDPASLGLGPTDAQALLPAIADAPLEPAAIAAPVVAQAHRRGLIMLIGVAAVLLIGVAVLVVVIVQKNDSDTNGGLVQNQGIDTERPEQLVFRQLPGEGSGSSVVAKPLPIIRHPVHPTGSAAPEDGGEGKGDKLKSDEIEDMARKQSAGTNRCYMRAQRGAEGIEIADLKKLSVTLTVDKTGAVSDVSLDQHQADSLGQCLIGQIKHWRFRESPGGLYRIILAFAS